MQALTGFGIFCCAIILALMFLSGIDDESIIYIYVLLGLAFASFLASAICDAYVKSKTPFNPTDIPNKDKGHDANKAESKLASP